jgi:transcriptional regulator with GAF, ATPase, and Fis domain
MPLPTAFSIEQVAVGESARMRAVFDLVAIVARSDSNVVITGETGTGKEVIANMLHHLGKRRHQPFVAVSCALFSESLIETELFGHERGAFTGAIKDKPGRFELAAGGTLFLDDIDDVPLAIQVKLLRAIQNRQVERVGGTRTLPINARVIAGTKRDLRKMVADGTFREDLFYRLNVLPIVLPPLRERHEDIPALTQHFLTRFSRDRNSDVPELSPAVMAALARYRWPGNVRELENICERIVQTCSCGTARVGCLSSTVLFGAGGVGTDDVRPSPPTPISLDDRLLQVEQNLIAWALKVADGNKSRAASLLNIKRSTLGDRIARCGLQERESASSREEGYVAASLHEHNSGEGVTGSG